MRSYFPLLNYLIAPSKRWRLVDIYLFVCLLLSLSLFSLFSFFPLSIWYQVRPLRASLKHTQDRLAYGIGFYLLYKLSDRYILAEKYYC
jgi:hypothetical protein